jgi:hypothetical protein
VRRLQQSPSVENGLSRTGRQFLELVEVDKRDFASLFTADREREERLRAIHPRADGMPASPVGRRGRWI